MIKSKFDAEKVGDLGSISFFVTLRKSKEFKAISTAIARDPEGNSRIP